MAYTMQQLVDYARVPLNDAKLTPAGAVRTPRYADTELLSHAKQALHVCRRDRPDLFFDQFTLDVSGIALGAAFPLPDEYFQPISDYVSARAQTKDGEEVTDAKAPMFFMLFAEGKGDK